MADPGACAMTSETPASVADWLAQIEAANNDAEFLQSVDLAARALAVHDDRMLRYHHVLALARSGATNRAHQLFRDYGLHDHPDEDVAALCARLAKDFALSGCGADRPVRASVAALLYEQTFRRTGGFYPGVNAATMWLLAGKRSEAEELARRVLDICRGEGRPASDTDRYYVHATTAEAALILRDLTTVRRALEQASAHAHANRAASGATRRQLRLVCELNEIDVSILERLSAPAVIHYTGHMVGRLVPQYEHLIAQRIRDHVEAAPISIAFGSLASGADILFAEAFLQKGVDLHVVLPCHDEAFIAMSVAKAGREWIPRFERCRDSARSVSYASDDVVSNDRAGLAYAASVAMGLAVMRARHLDASVEQLAVWDGEVGVETAAGTEADMALWRTAGQATRVIACPPAPRPALKTGTRDEIVSPRLPRAVRAFLFGDVGGFSKLREEQLPNFVNGVMLRFAEVLERYGGDILARNTWGDGVYLVFRDAVAAAQCALDVQQTAAELDLPALGLPADLAFRISGHSGPVFEVVDPVLQQAAFVGSHITRTARIEPITPEGEVYITEQFAALLALQPGNSLRAEYVGHMPAAKGYGALRMYVLKRDTL